MGTVRRSNHNVSELNYHFVTPVKFRKAIFGKPDREQSLHAICKEIEERYEIQFIQVGIDTNHVHYLISSVPRFSPSTLIRIIKSIMARELFKRHPDLKKELWGGNLWTSAFYVSTVSEHANKDVIRNYIKKQGIKSTQLTLFDFNH